MHMNETALFLVHKKLIVLTGTIIVGFKPIPWLNFSDKYVVFWPYLKKTMIKFPLLVD